MPTLTIEYGTDVERLQYERMIAYVREMSRLGLTAAHGMVMDQCERHALKQGRQLIRDHLESAVQARADAEKKFLGRGRRAASPAS